jgi:hypothetical protein
MRRADGSLATLPRIGLGALVAAGFVLAASDPFTILFFASYIVVGALLVVRRPDNIVSWLLVAIAFGLIGIAALPHVDIAAVNRGQATSADSLTVWLVGWAGAATFVGYLGLTVLFPSGRLPDGRWRLLASVLLGAGILIVILTAFAPTVTFNVNDGGITSLALRNPAAIRPDLVVWSWLPLADGGALPVIALLAVGVSSMFVRYHHAQGVLQLQLRWLVAAVLFVLVTIVIGLVATEFFGERIGGAAWIPVGVAYPTIPLAIGIAILRYRLYEIDRIVNRALVYGAVTAILAGVFAAATALSQRVFIAVTGETSDAALVLTTLAVATLYAPLRTRVEGVVERFFKYDQRQYGAYRDELTRLLELIDPVQAAGRLAREAMAETAAAGAAVTDARGRVVATAGTWSAPPTVTVPIRSHSGSTTSPLGSVLLGPRRDGQPHRPVRLEALSDIATVVATALGDRRSMSDWPSAQHRAARDRPEVALESAEVHATPTHP